MSGNKNQKRIQVQCSAVFRIILLACGLLLAGSYVFLNLARFTAQMDSDIAAEALNARAIWVHKALIPATFYPSTERRILNVNLIGALFYGLTGNMNLSMGIACCVMGAAVLALYGLLLKRLGFEKVPRAAAMTILLAIPGSMRHSQLLYLYAVYYAVHCICMMITLLILLEIRKADAGSESCCGKRGSADRGGMWALRGKMAAGVVLAFLISLSGLRAALICYAPLAATEVAQLIGERVTGGRIHRGDGTNREQKKRCAFYAFLLLAASFAGSRMPTAVGVATSRNLRGGLSKLLHTVLPDLLRSVYCENQSVLRTALVTVLLAAAVIGWIVSVREVHAFVLSFFWMSLLVSVVMGAFTTTESVWRYYFMIYYVLSFGTACLMQWGAVRNGQADGHGKWGHLLESLLAVFIAFLGLLVWKEELWPSMRQAPENAEYESIVQWMQEQGCEYGYSTYDSANAITGACNGAVQVSAVADLGTLDICKWLTDSDWYVPSLPVDMKTAYIVPKSLEESFLPSTERHSDIIEGLETENYIVYVAEHNYTCAAND